MSGVASLFGIRLSYTEISDDEASASEERIIEEANPSVDERKGKGKVIEEAQEESLLVESDKDEGDEDDNDEEPGEDEYRSIFYTGGCLLTGYRTDMSLKL